ncbi:MAG TPA: sigma-70 family RNA polymerase sigma factor [Solirubrobacterales bacterium]|nr:sigma-70 family RNA polymerase sigma factor [Solirubrobacterales bacterium]
MTDQELLAQRFEEHRDHLHSVAYRMLGSTGEADDAVQEAWMRLSRSDSDSVENLRAWLTTVVGRVSLDMLRARKARREQPDDHLEPIVSEATEDDPAQEAEIADSIGLAMLVVLENLSPAERVAFVLHDMFGVPFSEIGEITGREPDAARQLASRARRRVRGSAPPSDTDVAEQRRVVDAFLAAARAGDFQALMDVLDPDVVFRVHAAEGDRRAEGLPASGAEQVAGRILTRGRPFAHLVRPAMVNGAPGTVAERDGKILGAMACTVRNGRIATMDLVIDPDRFRGSRD